MNSTAPGATLWQIADDVPIVAINEFPVSDLSPGSPTPRAGSFQPIGQAVHQGGLRLGHERQERHAAVEGRIGEAGDIFYGKSDLFLD